MNKQTENFEEIFKNSLKVRNYAFIIAFAGLALYNIAPEAKELCFWMMGAGFTLGIHINSRIKNEKKSIIHGYLLSNEEGVSKIDINGVIYSLPSSSIVFDSKNKFKLYNIALIATSSSPTTQTNSTSPTD